MEQTNNGAVGTVQTYPGGARLYKEEKKRKNWFLILLCVLVLLAAGGYTALCGYAHTREGFYPNRHINDIDVGGLTAEQAQQKLEQTLLAQNVILRNAATGEELIRLTLEEVGYSADSFSGDAAWWLAQQQSTNFFLKGWEFFNVVSGRWPGGSNWPEFDAAVLEKTVQSVAERFTVQPRNASYEVEEDTVRVETAEDGRILHAEFVKTALMNVGAYSKTGFETQVSFEPLPAQGITARQIHDDIYDVMKNASYDIATGSILPESMGADFDVAAAQKILDKAAPGTTVRFAAAIERPAVTAEELEEVLFRDVLAEYKTLVTGTTARRTNVRLAAEKINGIIMNAGDVFSYNQSVGKRTEEAGFQPAPAYVQGETVDEVGGGICQTSSTLYYACLQANLEITERYAHRYVPAYVPWGMDATVSWGGPDYKFTNSTLYPLKIETEYKNSYVTVRLVGTNIDGSYAEMTNEVLSRTDYVTEYVEDPSVAPGTTVEKTTPYTGYKVKSYRHVYDGDGNLVSSALEDTSNYKVRNRVMLVAPGELPGQKPAAVTPPVSETPAVEQESVQEETPAEMPAEPAGEDTQETAQ